MLTAQAPDPDRRVRPGEPFRFACSASLPCFNTCCRNKDLILTPYDVLRLKGALRLDSDRFLERHVLFRPDPDSGFPVLSLRMLDEPEKRCPFVGQAGCTVYGDRPTACRLYPLGRATARTGGGDPEEVFFLLHAPACRGLATERSSPLEAWLEGQGLGPYRRFNNRMLEVLFHPRRVPGRRLSPEQVRKVIVACYNADAFRSFLFGSGFLKQAGVPSARRRKIRSDDEALLSFGFEFLERVLYAR